MDDTHFIGGHVEKILAYGKCGFLRGVDGNVYFYSSKSLKSVKKRLKPEEAVVFLVHEAMKEGQNPVAYDIKTVSEMLNE